MKRMGIGLLLALGSLYLAMAPVVRADDIVVGCNTASLSNAINTANNNLVDDTIILSSGCVYDFAGTTPSGSTILPTIISDSNHSLIIAGNGATFERSAAPEVRFLQVDRDARLTIQNLTLEHGKPSGTALGGAIYNQGYLTLTQVSILKCQASEAGGIYNIGQGLFIDHSAIIGNQAKHAGALYNDGPAWIRETTLAENGASMGDGGIANHASLTLTHVSLLSNRDDSYICGTLHNYTSGSVSVYNTLIGGDSWTQICVNDDGGTISSSGYNLTQQGSSCPTDGPNDQTFPSDELFSSVVAHRVGLTYAPLPDSPAVDAGYCPGETTDQRYGIRPFSQPHFLPPLKDGCDIGAYETHLELTANPQPNSHSVKPFPEISLTYDHYISPTAIITGALTIHTQQTPLPQQIPSVIENQLVLPLEKSLHAGELVQGTALTTTMDITGESSQSAVVWQFRRATEKSGSGILTDTGQLLGTRPTLGIAAGDLDGDLDLDFIGVNDYYSSTVWINQDGSGQIFTSTQDLVSSCTSVQLGDLDNDGDLDAFFTRNAGMPSAVWLNDGQAHFSDSEQALSNDEGYDAALGDFDADGDLDAIVADAATGQPMLIWKNDGSALYSLKQSLNLGTSNKGWGVDIGDLDADGDLDIFALGTLTSTIWFNDGHSIFTVASTITFTASDPSRYDVALGDLDNDGDLDVYLARGGQDLVLLNRGDGHFTSISQTLSTAQGQHVTLGDVNGDGNLDAVLTTQLNGIEIWLGRGDGSFQMAEESLSGYGTYNVALADVNSDGDLDLLIAINEANQVWANRDLVQTPYPTPAACSVPVTTEVSFKTSTQLDEASVLSATFPIHSSFQGLMPGIYTVGDKQAEFHALSHYHAGDRIEALVTSDVMAGGVPIANSYVWRFRTEATKGAGHFNFSRNLGNEEATDVALGDLDGDGSLDAFITTQTGKDSIWLHNGSTWYTTSQSWGAESSTGVALGDMNNDGTLDALIAQDSSSSKLCLNTGHAVFDCRQYLAPNGQDVAVGDIDGDGDLDAVFANGGAPANVWFNNGTSTLTLGITLTAPYTMASVAMGDLDLDGDLDLVFGTGIATEQPNLLWYNDGHGNFFSVTLGSLADKTTSWGVAVGDVNCDGYPDLAFANHAASYTANLWLNQGDGTFRDSLVDFREPACTNVAMGDVDADGDLDLIFAAYTMTHSVWLNVACGTFVPGQGFPNGNLSSVALGDLDNSGGLDILFTTEDSSANSIWRHAERVENTYPAMNDHQVAPDTALRVDYSAAINTATFTTKTLHLYGGFHGAITGTINAVGRIVTPSLPFAPGELIQATAISNVIMSDGYPVAQPYVWQFQAKPRGGTGTYAQLQALGAYSSTAVALGDLDGDGDLDAMMVLGKYAAAAPDQVWLNNGDGTFTLTAPLLGNISSSDVALGDMDADGDLDALVTSADTSMTWFNSGNGQFTISYTLPITLVKAVALGDLDGDGDLDAFFAGGSIAIPMKNAVWLNDGYGVLTPTQTFGPEEYHQDVALGDVDGDGDLDAFVVVSYGANSVWINDGHGHFYDGGQLLGSADSYGVALGDLDGDGDLDAFVANDTDPNIVWLNNGQGYFAPTINLGDQDYSHVVTLGDVDDDGDLDAFVGNVSGQDSVLWLNDGSGHFVRHQKLPEKHVSGATMGDLEGDGDLDIFVASYLDGHGKILRNAAQANLAIQKNVWPTSIMSRRPLTYTLTLINRGPGEATSMIVSDTLPPEILSPTVSSDVFITRTGSGQLYRWEIADLAAGATAHITVTGILSPLLPSGISITNTATLTSSEVDTDTVDNRSSAVVLVTQDQAQTNPFVVNTTDDDNDGVCGIAHCSLREAIRAAVVETASQSEIAFSIPGTGPHVIKPQTPLPNLSGASPINIDARDAGVIISGTFVSQRRTSLRVDDISLQLDGGDELLTNGDFSNGLEHWAPWGDSCAVSRTMDSVTYHTAAPSYLQTTPACAMKNDTIYSTQITPTLPKDVLTPTSSVWLDVVGHTTLTTSLWFRDGDIEVALYALHADHSVEPLAMRMDSMGSDWQQVLFTTTLPGETIAVAFQFGHALPSPDSGLQLGDNVHVQGLDILGFPIGIQIIGSNNSIGGPEAGVMVGDNFLYGIHIKGHTNFVQGSFVGIARDGLTPHPNPIGLFIEGSHNRIGGAKNTYEGNTFGHNDESAIELGGMGAYSNSIQGNNIGIAAKPIPNDTGVTLFDYAHDNIIGGDSGSLANFIAYNKGSGIRAFCDTYNNSFLHNLIYDNGGLAIDLDADGPTPNDPGDRDEGANHLQNTPVIFHVTPVSPTTVIKGRLDGISHTEHVLEFYTSTLCAGNGRGEAQGYLGSLSVTTTERGDAYFAWTYLAELPYGTRVAATATDAHGNTSELSDCALAADDNIAWPLAKDLDPLFTATLTHTTRAAVMQRIGKEGESHWYKFSVIPNSQVIVLLTQLPANYDLTIYKDIAQAYTTLTGPEDLIQMSAEFAPDAFAPDAFAPDAFAPDAFAPNAFAPDAFAPDAFAPDAFAPDAFAPDAFAPDAFASAQLRSLLGISAFNGTTSEGLLLNTWNNTGNFYIRVRGRHGEFNTQHPYTLTVYVESALCNNVSDALPEISTVPATKPKTLIITDFSRMSGSAEEKDTLQSKLSALAAKVTGTIVDVAEDARVYAANKQADAHPMCPYAKNLVADAIKQIVSAYRQGNPTMQYVVLVGNDDVIPFFRYPDQAMLASEQNYSPPVRDNTASQASLKLGYVLGQDAYGSNTTISYKSTRIPLPELAVGRLVETPADIIAVLDAYLSLSNGIVTRSTSALVTGYDFLTDDAMAVKSILSTTISGTVDTLITPRDIAPSDPRSWTAEDLKARLLGQHYDLVFLAGHFSASSALAADYSTHLYTSDVLSSTVSMSNTILFSAGCHSGYNIVNNHDVPFVTREPDWAQTFARKGATFIGGTGYQYGDTDYIEYSERIYELLAHTLQTPSSSGQDSVAVGEALVAAKQEYLAEIAELRGIHIKSYLEATLFGLPMLSLPTAAAPMAPTRPADETIVPALHPFTQDPGKTLELNYADLSLIPTLTMTTTQLQSVDSDAVYTATIFVGPDGVKNAPLEPVLPLALYNVTAPGYDSVLRGIGFRGGVYSDVHKIIPLTGAAATEVRGVHAPFRISTFFPVRLWNLNYFNALGRPLEDGKTRLMLFPAQYRSTIPGTVDGTMRLFHTLELRLYYSKNHSTYSNGATPALSAPPVIEDVSAENHIYTVTFQARVYGDPAAGIQEVWITYNLGGNAWRSLEMTQDADNSLLWHATLTSTSILSEVQYMVQAVNGVGLVTMNTHQGAYYDSSIRFTAPPAEPTPTELQWLTRPISGAYGTRALFRLQLSTSQSSRIPLSNEPIEVGLGAQRKIKMTNSSGIVTITLPLMGRPRVDRIQVNFAGSDYFQASSVTGDFTITKQATSLALHPTALTPDRSAIITATLQDAQGRPLGNKQLLFVLSGGGQCGITALTTNFAGIAHFSLRLQEAGHYTVTAHFGGEIMVSDGTTMTQEDERYHSTQTILPITVGIERSYLYLPLVMRGS